MFKTVQEFTANDYQKSIKLVLGQYYQYYITYLFYFACVGVVDGKNRNVRIAVVVYITIIEKLL